MIKVYHGATRAIEHPDASRGRDNLDFGKGFYVTRMKSQACRWASVVYSRYEEDAPTVNTDTLDTEAIEKEGYRTLAFEAYDEKWIDFIAASRTGRRPWIGYDMIEGGIADDRVIDTVEGYINGDSPADVATGRLIHHKPNNQIAILSQEILDRHLKWIKAETLSEDTE